MILLNGGIILQQRDWMTEKIFKLTKGSEALQLDNMKDHYGFGFPFEWEEEVAKFCNDLNNSFSKMEKLENNLKGIEREFQESQNDWSASIEKFHKENQNLKIANRELKEEIDYWKKRALLLENKYGETPKKKILNPNGKDQFIVKGACKKLTKTSLRPKPTK